MQSTTKKLKRVKNLSKFAKRPITNEQIDALQPVALNALSFQRSMRPYYKTSLKGQLLTLICPIMGKSVRIDFIPDNNNYITIKPIGAINFINDAQFTCLNNRDLMVKIRRNSLL